MSAPHPGPAGAAAVLFDLDGLLVDSEPLWLRAERAVAARYGVDWTEADQRACLGGSLEATARHVLDRATAPAPAGPGAVMADLLSAMAGQLAAGVPVRPGALELLDAVAAAGVPCGLVSNTYRQLVDLALAGLGRHRFRVSVAGDEVSRRKPDPQPYLLACARLGARPSRCVVLEDSPAGIAAAEAAGCTCVAVPDLVAVAPTPTRPVRRDLREVDPAWLLGLPAAAA